MTDSNHKALVDGIMADAVTTLSAARDTLADATTAAGELLLDTLHRGGKVLLAGNGGSAADAQHMAAELINRFETERPALPALALTTDSAVLTSISNDYAYDRVFARQVEGLGVPGDLFIAFSTSGRSPNIVAALAAARDQGMRTLLLSGRDGGPAAEALGPDDIELRAPAQATARIQEVHGMLIHCLCAVVDQFLCNEVPA